MKKVESRKEENEYKYENEDKYENENEDDDEYEYKNEDDNETMDQNKKIIIIIKGLNDNLHKIIDKSKPFEDQIKSLKKSRISRRVLFYQ